QAHSDFAAERFIPNAFAVLVRLGDPRVVPCFRCSFLLGMPPSRTAGSSSAALAQFFADNICLRQGVNGSALPDARHPLQTGEVFHGFTGSLSLQLSLRPVELLAPLADLTRLPPSQQGLLLPSFPSGRLPFPWSTFV